MLTGDPTHQEPLKLPFSDMKLKVCVYQCTTTQAPLCVFTTVCVHLMLVWCVFMTVCVCVHIWCLSGVCLQLCVYTFDACLVTQEVQSRRQRDKAQLMKATRRLTITSVLLSRRRDMAQSIFDEVWVHEHSALSGSQNGVI